MTVDDTLKPVVVIGGDTVRASGEVADDLQMHLCQRGKLHGPTDAGVVAEGAVLGGLRYLGEIEGHAAVADRLRFWLKQAETFAALSSVPAGMVTQ